MKNKLILLSILSVVLSVVATACQKRDFSPVAIATNNSQGDSPSDPNCVSDPENLIVPGRAGSGEVFTMSYNRIRVAWTLSVNGGDAITYTGSPVSTSFAALGNVHGTVSGVDNCGLTTSTEFDFPLVMGHSEPQPDPSTTTTTTLPAPVLTTTTSTTLHPVTTTTTQPPVVVIPPTTTLPHLPPNTTLPPATTTTVTTTSTTTTLPPVVTPPTTPITQEFTATGGGKADILFVVNDASTMFFTLRDDVPYRFAEFFQNLGDVDYRVAVTSAQATGSATYQSGRLTSILYQPVPFSGYELIPRQYYVTPTMKHPEQDILATIMRPEAICIQVAGPCPIQGHQYQEGIHSSILALSDSANVSKFIRPEAPLNIVYISESDEGSGSLTDKKGNVKPGTPAYNLPDTLINLVHSKWPGKEFKVHAMVVPTNHLWCNNPNQYGSNTGFLYSDLVKKTGGALSSICDNNERKSVNQIAKSIAAAPAAFDLQCAPKNLTATYSPQPSVPTRVVVDGNHVSFTPVLPKGTKVRLSYTCQ